MLRIISYGGGVQSTALLVLAAERRIDFRTFVFANVGDDSEDPATLDYIAQHAVPFAERTGIELHKVSRVPKKGAHKGEVETLFGRLTRAGSRSLPIPIRMSNGAPGTRSCTADFKIKTIGSWLQAHGASPLDKATVGVGISLDEIHRVNQRKAEPYEDTIYPLLDHTPPLRRSDCARIIERAGLPVPPKSACWFCPFHRPSTWAEMRRDRPELFKRACDLEDLLNGRRQTLQRDPVFLTRFNKPLSDAIPEAQAMLPLLDQPEDGEVGCDNGMCFT